MAEKPKTYTKEFRIYKPTKDIKGAATKIGIVLGSNAKGYDKLSIFLTSALEIKGDDPDNAAFAWNDEGSRVIAQLGDPDIAAVLAVVSNLKDGLGNFDKEKNKWTGLFHKFDKVGKPKDSTIINMVWGTGSKGDPVLNYQVSAQRNGVTVRVSHSITLEEALIIKSICESYFQIKYGTIL